MKTFALFLSVILTVFAAYLLPKNLAPLPGVTLSIVGSANTFFVSPSGDDGNNGRVPQAPFQTIQKAVDLAGEGDTIVLAEGVYLQDFVSRRDGSRDAPIRVTGPVGAVLKGGGASRVVEINHSYITLDGFSIDGRFGEGEKLKDYRDKLIYLLGKGDRSGVAGVKILNMVIQNAGGECVRLRYFARENEIAGNRIQNCGLFDFRFGAGGKNGEGIYIGTAPEQREDGKNPTKDPDESNNNWIHDNIIDTEGNECIDIKEGAWGNMVEENKCSGQKDPESGGMDSRGNGNTFRNNEIYGNSGVGVRVGGDFLFDGVGNHVYSNVIRDNKKGGIKFQRAPQGKVCGNIMEGNKKNSLGSFGVFFNPTVDCPA